MTDDRTLKEELREESAPAPWSIPNCDVINEKNITRTNRLVDKKSLT
jgi:hypothetical protein